MTSAARVPKDLEQKAAIMREFGRLRAAGQPIPAELQAKHVNATNDGYTTGPEPGERIPNFSLVDQDGVSRSVANSPAPTAYCWYPIAARIGDATAAPNSSSWNNADRFSKRKASASPRSATISKTLHNFAQQHEIGFPLLSDPDSAVIRSFGILNTNIAPELRAHGVPHPVQYLVAPDGAMVRKYFVPNYQLTSRRRLSLCANSESRVTARQSLHCATARSRASWPFDRTRFRRPGNRFFREIRPRARLAYLWLAASGELHSDSVQFDDPKIMRQSFQLPQPRRYESPGWEKRCPFTVAHFKVRVRSCSNTLSMTGGLPYPATFAAAARSTCWRKTTCGRQTSSLAHGSRREAPCIA